MIGLLASGNLFVRLLVEAAALGSVALWAWSLPLPTAGRTVAAIAAPILLAAGWALLLSPGSSVAMPPGLRITLQLSVFALATLALVATGRNNAAAGFASLAVVNAVLLLAWNQ